jgi:hypothetical protein
MVAWFMLLWPGTASPTQCVRRCAARMLLLCARATPRSGQLNGSLAAHPGVPGQIFYAVGSSIVTMFEVRSTRTHSRTAQLSAC